MITYRHAKDRAGTVYVSGTLDGVFERISTGLPATKKNMDMVDKDWREWIRRLRAEGKGKLAKEPTKKAGAPLKEYGARSLAANAYLRKACVQKEYASIFQKRILPFFGSLNIEDIRPSHCREWQNSLIEDGLSGGRAKNIRTVLEKILNEAVEDDIIASNPFKKNKKAKSSCARDISVQSQRGKTSYRQCRWVV
jgi:hypothetical protein